MRPDIMDALARLLEALKGTEHEADAALLNKAMNPTDGSDQLRLTGYLAFAFKESPAPALEEVKGEDEDEDRRIEEANAALVAAHETARGLNASALEALANGVHEKLRGIAAECDDLTPGHSASSAFWVTTGDRRE